MTTLRQPTMPVSPAEVEEALARILAAEPFANAPSLAAFLRFIVEETLAGRDDRLKAYTIAVGALDRPVDFDPNENPLVRVQARRLRAALDRYRLGEGRDAPVHIELPIGTYVPVFVRGDAPPAAATAPAPPPRLPSMRALVTAALVGLALVAALLGDRWTTPPAPPPAANTPSGVAPNLPPAAPAATTAATVASPTPHPQPPRQGKDLARVLPLLVVEVDLHRPAPPDLDAELYRRRLEGFAQHFDDTIVVTRRAPAPPLPESQPIYLLHLAVVRDGGSTNAYHQLVHAADRRVLRAGAIRLTDALPRIPPEDARLAPPLDEDLALVREIVEVGGTIDRDLRRHAELGSELRCITRARLDRFDSPPEQRGETRRCLEEVVAANPRITPALTLLAADLLAESRDRPEDEAAETRARAEALLARANRLSPGSSAPLRQIAELLALSGDFDAAALAGRRALDANPDDLAAVAAYGVLMARIGEYERARLLLARVTSEDPSAPKWVQFHAFLALNALGRTQDADDRVAFFDATESPLYLTAVILRARRRGAPEVAERAQAALLRAAPEFETDPVSVLRRQGLAEPVARRLLEDLWAAGLPRPAGP